MGWVSRGVLPEIAGMQCARAVPVIMLIPQTDVTQKEGVKNELLLRESRS